MQWTDQPNAGFTEGTPWIPVNPNYKTINAQQQTKDADSIFHYYRRLVQLRKEYDVIAYGDIRPLAEEHPRIFAYQRTYQGQRLIVVNNFYGTETEWRCPVDLRGCQLLLGNYFQPPVSAETLYLRPFEAAVWYCG